MEGAVVGFELKLTEDIILEWVEGLFFDKAFTGESGSVCVRSSNSGFAFDDVRLECFQAGVGGGTEVK